MPFVVQFPHPGREHKPSPPAIGTVMPWNRGAHGRKFLRSPAEYLDVSGPQQGEVGFWGEWEAQSRVLDVWKKDGGKPRFLHEPFYDPPTDSRDRQNIDPFVFGDEFLYTNCKQLSSKKLRNLTPGSLILFGSGSKPGFVLDTVFVVGDDAPRPYEIGERHVLPQRPETDPLIFQPLSTSTRHLGMSCRAYQSRPYKAGDDRPFSFVPCRPLHDPELRFARPLLEPVGPLDGLINPLLFMSTRVTHVDEDTLTAAWTHVRTVMESQQLKLGVRIAMPPKAASEVPEPVVTGRAC